MSGGLTQVLQFDSVSGVQLPQKATGQAAWTAPAVPIAAGVTQVMAASGNVANASAASTIAAVAGKLNYLTGLYAAAGGATAGSIVALTITGLAGGTVTLPVSIPAGATLAATPVNLTFNPPLPASAVNTAIVVTLAAAGAGNTNAATMAHGFYL